MFTRKYLLLCFLFILSCGSPKNREQEVNVFLTEWSAALTAGDESLPRFYDSKFSFPKAVFDAAQGLNYTFDVDHVKIASNEDNNDMLVTVPFHLTYPDNTSEDGTIDLTIAKTEKGFLILQMSQQLAMKLKEYNLRQTRSDYSEITLRYDSLLRGIRTMADALRQHYDSVAFYTEIGDQILFYVIKGNWEFPYPYENEKQRDGGNYKMGVVTAENKVIIPVAYTKIYNPDGSFNGMIEVEDDGARGLFRIDGEVFLPAEFDGIYTTAVPGAFAQVKKGDSYGWVSDNGKVSFDPSSHGNKTLFQSPVETNAILEWEFKFPGQIKILVDPYTPQADDTNGVIIYPSYIRDLGITSIGNSFVLLDNSEYGMGMTNTEIKFEKVESLSDKFFGLISFFMESGVGARGFHTTRNDLLVVDKSMKLMDHQDGLTTDYEEQDPCGGKHPSYRTIEPGLYESEDGNGSYDYYKITAEGTVEQMKTNRQYNFTKFAKIDDSYFDQCHYDQIEYKEDEPNVVLIKGISSEDLDIMRNEIFAEYGFIFKSPKWKTYFESKPWYTPQYVNVDRFLTETDKANIKFILDYQRLHKGMQVQRDSIFFGWAG